MYYETSFYLGINYDLNSFTTQGFNRIEPLTIFFSLNALLSYQDAPKVELKQWSSYPSFYILHTLCSLVHKINFFDINKESPSFYFFIFQFCSLFLSIFYQMQQQYYYNQLCNPLLSFYGQSIVRIPECLLILYGVGLGRQKENQILQFLVLRRWILEGIQQKNS